MKLSREQIQFLNWIRCGPKRQINKYTHEKLAKLCGVNISTIKKRLKDKFKAEK